MTPRQIAGALKATGPITVLGLSCWLRVHVSQLWGPLIASESLGLVRVTVEGQHGNQERRIWEAM